MGTVAAVVGEHRMDRVRDRCDQPPQEVGGGLAADLLVQLDEGELSGAVDGHDHVQLALLGAQFGDVDVEVADRVGLERLPGGLLGLDGQAGDVAPLEQPMQRRAGQVRDPGTGPGPPAARTGSHQAAAA